MRTREPGKPHAAGRIALRGRQDVPREGPTPAVLEDGQDMKSNETSAQKHTDTDSDAQHGDQRTATEGAR